MTTHRNRISPDPLGPLPSLEFPYPRIYQRRRSARPRPASTRIAWASPLPVHAPEPAPRAVGAAFRAFAAEHVPASWRTAMEAPVADPGSVPAHATVLQPGVVVVSTGSAPGRRAVAVTPPVRGPFGPGAVVWTTTEQLWQHHHGTGLPVEVQPWPLNGLHPLMCLPWPTHAGP